MNSAVGFPKVEIGQGSKKPTVVFLAGFPDDQLSSWGPELRAGIAEDYHVLFLCLPGFEKDGTPKRWGYSFDELDALLHHTIEQSTMKDEKIFLVGHDWGSFVAHKYQNKHPEKVKKLALVDVVSQLVSLTIAHFMFLIFTLPIFAPLFKGLWEETAVGDRMKRDKKVVLRCYPYFHLWKMLLTGTTKYPHFPTCPLLYLYGANKKFMFHDKEFLSTINAKKDCKYLGLPAGHWIGVTHEDVTLRELRDFFKD